MQGGWAETETQWVYPAVPTKEAAGFRGDMQSWDRALPLPWQSTLIHAMCCLLTSHGRAYRELRSKPT